MSQSVVFPTINLPTTIQTLRPNPNPNPYIATLTLIYIVHHGTYPKKNVTTIVSVVATHGYFILLVIVRLWPRVV